MPSKADRALSCSYAVLRYLVDAPREITVPVGVVLWSASDGRLWFRLPSDEEQIEGAPTSQARAYAAIARDKIEGWHRLGELPYQSEPLEPLCHAWWEAVSRMLQWRVRLGPVRDLACESPEADIEQLYESIVQPDRSAIDLTNAECVVEPSEVGVIALTAE